MRILIADDEKIARLMLGDMVRRLGHECVEAADGAEAWDAYLRLHPEVVITDRVMPGVDGLDLCRRIRSDGSGRYTYLALLTARCASGEVLEGVRAGVDDYLVKPLEPFGLEVMLTSAARVTALHDRLRAATDELRRTNAELAESEERTRIALAAGRMGTFEIAPATGEVVWSPELAAIHGVAPGEFDGRIETLDKLMHPDDLGACHDSLVQLRRTGAAALQFRIVRPDGEVRNVETCARLVPGETPADERVVGVLADVTDRRRAETMLRDSEERWRHLVEASPLAIVEFDSALRVSLWNEAAEAIFGWTAAEVAGSSSLLALQDPAFRELVERMVGGDRVAAHELRASRRDGSLVELMVGGAPLRDEAGRIHGAIFMAADVSDRKSLEAQLLQSQKLESVGRLAGGIAHDFNNLLTTVLGYSELMLDEVAPGTEQAQALTAIHAAAERGAALTARLMTFSRKRAGAKTVVAVNEVVEGIRDLLVRTLGEDITIETRTGPHAGCIASERAQLDQVLLNLAVNGRDAMPHGGTLSITTSRFDVVPSGPGAGSGLPGGRYVNIAVTDTGVGMDAHTLANCFEPFFTTRPQGKGTGLGLSTVYGIVTGLGGRVKVDSAPGRGTTFELLLPTVACGMDPGAAQDSGAGSRPTALRDTGSTTVLVVEDEEGVRLLAKAILAREGYEVLTAANGAEALWLARAHPGPVHLLLTDIVMPVLGGIELARTFARERPEVAVVYMSGYTDRPLPQLRGGDDPWFVEKPFQADTLLATVRTVLQAAPWTADVGERAE